MIYSKNDIVLKLLQSKSTLRSFGTARIGVTGSFAKGTANDKSDIDLLIEFEPGKKTFKNYTGAYLFLKELLNRDIDFLTLESLSPYLAPYILKDIEYVSISN